MMAIKDEGTPVAPSTRPKILYLDAYDSFSNNIIAQVEQSIGADVSKLFIDDSRFRANSEPDRAEEPLSLTEYLKDFDAVIAGPGPGWATDEKDVGLMQDLWKLERDDLLPVLGICLGFQSMAVAFGAETTTMIEPRHGVVSDILHKGHSIFSNVDQLLATQYHSLQVSIGHAIQTKRAVRYPGELWEATELCPLLEPLAWDFDNKKNGAVLMALRHTEKPFWGVQFHPESICTNKEGANIIQNWWESAMTWNTKRALSQTVELVVEPLAAGAPLTMDRLRDVWGLSYRDAVHGKKRKLNAISSNKSFDEAVREVVEFEKQREAPRKIANIILYGDDKTVKGYEPEMLHCATTGSGRLTVSNVCEIFEVQRSEAIVLESGLQSDLLPLKVGTGRYSIIGLIIPGETLRLHYYSDTKTIQLRGGEDEVVFETVVQDVWFAIKTIMQRLKPRHTPSGPTFAPFWGGLVGFASYEAGLETINVVPSERLKDEPIVPDICFAYVTRSIVFDHQVKKIYVQSIRGADDRAWVMDAIDRIYDAVGQKSVVTTPSSSPASNPFDSIPQNPILDAYLRSGKAVLADSFDYESRVRECQHFISEGHSYELCFTTQNRVEYRKMDAFDEDIMSGELSWKLYNRLTKQNTAPFSAYMRLHNMHILSSSPERYISWDRNGSAQCRPIKGTVQKRPGVTAVDALAILSSPKERAENLMIVDLVRHQLHGVYGAGNVHVSQLMEVEEYETLWQLVSVIDAVPHGVRGKARTPEEWEEPADYISGKKASLNASNQGYEAFVNSLPPGSMTGAPKKRSCEILKELEGNKRRGIYSGVLGYLDVGGGGDFSVVIRTAVKIESDNDSDKDVWTIGAGGAVTAQSTPQGEYEEMVGKFNSTSRPFKL
ncbi:para-aminobenzoate synthase component 1 [Lophiotrema nucula]|uniref:aminodeoxychorismate synthase n=1 Tax=Lophiotrema nucula TaxID=690887 RepID=A0A6A5ZI77_9PLEO|nr:para-aminobenzoate synthase component 1 [Lophiotrema nucula]